MRQRQWTLVGSQALSQAEKAAITAACRATNRRGIEAAISCLSPGRPSSTTRLTSVANGTETRYRFIQRYRSGFPENLGEEFDGSFTRLDSDQPRALRPSRA